MQICNAARLCTALFLLLTSFLCVSAEAQAASKLSLTVKPIGAAASDKMIPVAASATINIVLRNEGSDPLSNVLVKAKFSGVKLDAQDGWKADGDDAVVEIASIAAGEEATRRLILRVDMAPMPPGRIVEISVEARSGELSEHTTAKFQVGDCAAAFQAELTKLRISTISEVWPTADEMRKPDTSLPRTRYFRIGARKSNDLATLDRIAAGYQGRMLADHEFFREGVRYTVRRWSDELKAFAGQEPNPGICAVNNEMIEGIRKTISYVTTRVEPSQKAYARAMELLRRSLSANEADDLKTIAIRLATEAGVKFENPPQSIFQILEQAQAQLKEAKPAAEQLDNLSLVESVAWIEAQALRSKKLSGLIENSITGITQAHIRTCLCAY